MTLEEAHAWHAERYKIPEGAGLTEWPEFKALMKLLNVDVPKDAAVEVVYPEKNQFVRVVVNGRETGTNVSSMNAYQSPESIAWFNRLGIPWQMWTIELTIRFAPRVFPTFTMRAALSDAKE